MSAATSATRAEFNIWRIIMAAAAGTVIEWYDFYIFGSLAPIVAKVFFPGGNPTLALIYTYAGFATGFVVRPFGAVVFGRIGDLIGRKYAFLLTLLIMGFSTTLIGFIPAYTTIGIWSVVILISLRLLQGLALGGEYGGAAIYVAEHVPDSKRGFYTSFIQITATAGFFVSLLVINGVRGGLGDAVFAAWGWRVPFIISILLVGLSLYIRLSLKESPLFTRLKDAGKSSKAPIRESLGKGSGRNWGMILLALLGATMGQGVIWYTGQFYAQSFLTNTLKINFITVNWMVAVALVFGAPFFVFFGWLSDRIGRKWIILTGMLLGVITYVPIYQAFKAFANPLNFGMITLLIWVQVIYVTMVYGPIAAFLVEFFPGKIRYTSLSVPYHIGNGVFGGLVPLIATSLAAATGSMYAGLYYPMGIAAISFIVGALFLKETFRNSIWDEVGGHATAKVSVGDD